VKTGIATISVCIALITGAAFAWVRASQNVTHQQDQVDKAYTTLTTSIHNLAPRR